MNDKVLLVLGMHRSGTSLTANWLHHISISMGDEFVPAAASNKKGHFEDIDFFNLHKQILKQNQQDGNGLVNLDDNFWRQKDENSIEQLVKQKLKTRDYLAFKEPRTVLFLSIYEKLSVQLFSIIIYRPYWEVVDSLIRREINKMKDKFFKKNKNSLLNRLKFRNKKNTFIKNYTNKYLETWCVYNEILLAHTIKNPQNAKLVALENLEIKEKEIINILNEWGFETNGRCLNEVVDPKLLKNNPNSLKYMDLRLKKRCDTLMQELAEIGI